MHRKSTQFFVGGILGLILAMLVLTVLVGTRLLKAPVSPPAPARRVSTARIAVVDGLARDGERLVELLSEVDRLPPGMQWAEDDPVASGLLNLDPLASSGKPHLSFGEPREGDFAPQYVLVDSKPVLGVLAECVARMQWCVVQRKGSEGEDVIWKRSELYRQQWDEQRPPDAEWASWVGRSIPAGVDAAWIAVVDGKLALGRPRGGDPVEGAAGLAFWAGMAASDFACLVERTWKYQDPAFPCGSAVEPCSPYGGASYRGPSLPETVARWIHPRIQEIDLVWDRAELRAVHVVLEGELAEAEVRKALGLPAPGEPLPSNLLSIAAQPRGGKTRVSLRASAPPPENDCPEPR